MQPMRLCICLCKQFKNTFSNDPSRCLPEQKSSHIGCICMISFQRVSLNASSNRLPEQMRNRIGCICMVFVLYEFSNVFLENLDQSKHNHIGCIWMIFLYSMNLQMCSQIARLSRCIVTYITFERFFFSMSPQMFSQTVCMGRCKVAKVALMWFFSIVSFRMCPQMDRLTGSIRTTAIKGNNSIFGIIPYLVWFEWLIFIIFSWVSEGVDWIGFSSRYRVSTGPLLSLLGSLLRGQVGYSS